MAPLVEDDWSDSDDEVSSEVETSVLLGIPDGLVQAISDVNDAAVSRIGGHPAFLPAHEPSFSSSHCKVCSGVMELLVQMWCPFEDSPMDRAVYIWGCATSTCQGKEGSVRAWRGLRYNDKYAAKLEKKQAKKRAYELAKPHVQMGAEEKTKITKPNPFSMNITSNSGISGLGAQIFGDMHPTSSIKNTEADVGLVDEPSDSESESSSSEKSLLTAVASVTLAESPWKTAPSYPPLYLSTASEYLPPQTRPHLPPGTHVTDPTGDDGEKEKDISWASEAYEDSLEIDHVFERFTKRVGYEGEQCIRYELNGTPLPFSSDEIFQALFPAPTAPPLPVTKSAFTVVHTPKRSYAPSAAIPPCPSCGSKRVFECQLMPNLINVLRRVDANDTQVTKKLNDNERRKAVERALKANGGEARGMEWGTCMIYSCEKDCCTNPDGTQARECWREELVLVQVAV